MRKHRTREKLLTYGALGVGLGLILSDHRHLGLAVAAVAPLTIALEHPRAMRRALRAVPVSLGECGHASGRFMRDVAEHVGGGARHTARGLRWLAG